MMGILEKLRPVPRWKHADPAVRASAVYELGPDETDALRALAREDAEARVRRAAVSRLEDVALLGELARTDPDDDVRADAVRILAGLGAETADVSRALDVVRQLTAAGRSREVVVIARENPHQDIRHAVIDQLDDPRALGSVSRKGPDGATRQRALARMTDAEEILNVALKAEHTDVAVAALERISDLEALGAIAQRARSKVAARRARTRIHQIEAAARPVVEQPVAALSPADRERASALLQQADALVTLPDPGEAAAALAQVRLAWAELQADVELDEALSQQFESASDAVREAIAERERERAAEEQRARALAEEQAGRLAIVQQIEQLDGAVDGAAAQDRIAELRVAWDNLPPMSSEYAASLTRRFQDASRAFEDRERRRMLAAAASGRLDTLATELEQLLASDQPVEEIVARWRGLRRDADVLREYGSANPQASERLEQAVTALEGREQQHQQVRAKQEQDNLRRLQQLCRQVDVLLAGDALTLKAGDRALREVRAALDERPALPSKQDRQDLRTKLEAARAALGPRVQELRDADEWQRWANLQVQEELCREMDALKAIEDLEVAGRKMRELQSRWKQVALAPRAQGESMWRRFKTAQDEVYARTAAHAAVQNAERAANLSRKTALCAQADALADSSDWVRTATAIQALQAEWKTIGPVNRGHERAVWERFRAACDRFFTRRQEDLKRRKDDWNTNLAKKEALCAAAETASNSTDWDAAAATLKQLQAEWKTVGPVRKSKSEAVWQRFRAACDHFFERYKHRDQVDLQEKAAVREAIIRELEAMLPAEDAAAHALPDGLPAALPDGLPALVKDARARWQQAPELPRGLQQDLAARYHQTMGRLVAAWPAAFAGSDIDPEQTRKRMEKLVARIEELVPSEAPKRLSPTELLAQQLRERLAVNTMTGKASAVAGKGIETEESRWRTAEQEIRNAQTQWTRFGPVPAEVAGPLNDRFQRACRRFYDQRRKAS
jgi:Arc/MetJ-type ribon-helix-helix transcriptional regulator